ncbi:MAG: response regulator [Dissulfurimicrobium sp.]|uniref:response regulator n=1 Tax=Dissulfurimicrobium TaxID=1769732 RepID=UPI001EDC8829|nr:response regulator [Dissulfurimicrobium hydrothermale]UKL13632.1 response regulator [Dissulfurimicrobium hydrothermale]
MAQILVLDDVIDAGIMIKKILERKGHDVHVFDEEEGALDYAKGHPVELAILDIKLKKLTGIEVLEELKKTMPDIKVIILTGYPTIETARQAVDLGAVEYCIKPIDKDELEKKVAQVLKS